MKMSHIYNICDVSFFKKLKDYEAGFFGAVLACISGQSSELILMDNDGFVDVGYRKSDEVVPIFSIPTNLASRASKFCDFATTAFWHQDFADFMDSELFDGFSIINLNGNLVHAFLFNYSRDHQNGRTYYCIHLVYDTYFAPREATSLIMKCYKKGVFLPPD